MKTLTKAERDAIIASIKQGKALAEANCIENAIAWSDKHPETQPHFIIHRDKKHVIVY